MIDSALIVYWDNDAEYNYLVQLKTSKFTI